MGDFASDSSPIDPGNDFRLASQPHDAYFKQVFSDPATAAGFFSSHLPAEIVRVLHWEELAVIPGSFVKRSLQQAHSDLLFSVSAGGQKVLLYLLFEHQTTVDRTMPLRLLIYMTEIWQSHERKEGPPLPPIIPFVLHQGPAQWDVSTEFADLIRVPQEIAEPLRSFLPSFRHGLLDLTVFDPASGESDHTLRVILQLMKLAREHQRILDFWDWLANEENRLSENVLLLSLLYALHADSSLDVEQISHKLRSNPELQRATMSTAEKLIAQGHAQGLAKGVWIGKIHMLEQMMKAPLSEKTDLESKTQEELEQRFSALQRDYAARFKNG